MDAAPRKELVLKSPPDRSVGVHLRNIIGAIGPRHQADRIIEYGARQGPLRVPIQIARGPLVGSCGSGRQELRVHHTDWFPAVLPEPSVLAVKREVSVDHAVVGTDRFSALDQGVQGM